LKAKYFYRSPQKDEVDLVHIAGNVSLPIEIKMRESVSAKDAGALFKFLRYFGKKRDLLISWRDETELVNNGMAVKVLPYWKYWSIHKWIKESSA
jgi:predicted AAA+ superfamily ATPase